MAGKDFPYTPNPANVRRFLEFMRTAGVPNKVTGTYLEGVGFTSSNDRYIPSVLRAVGLIDDAAAPTELWRLTRDATRGPMALGNAIRQAYAGLFEAYPDAQKREAAVIRNYFSANTDAAESVLSRMVGTFRSLCDMASFEDVLEPVVQSPAEPSIRTGPAEGLVSTPPAMPGAETYAVDGVFLRIIPSRKNIDRARKILEVVELSLAE